MLAEFGPIADALDTAHHGQRYREAIDSASKAMAEPQTLPSARVMDAVKRDFDGTFTAFALARSRTFKQQLLDEPWSEAMARLHRATAAESMQAQQRMEAEDQIPFEDFRRWYLDPARLEPDRI